MRASLVCIESGLKSWQGQDGDTTEISLYKWHDNKDINVILLKNTQVRFCQINLEVFPYHAYFGGHGQVAVVIQFSCHLQDICCFD